jgi:Histidine kinase
MNRLDKQKINVSAIEVLVYVFIWGIIISIPVFNHRRHEGIHWEFILIEWADISIYFVLFIINSFFLVPRYLFNKRYTAYVVTTLVTVALLLVVGFELSISIKPPDPPSMPPMEIPGMPPMELGKGMAAPIGYRPSPPPEEKPWFMILMDQLIISVLVIGTSSAFKVISQWLKEEARRVDVENEYLKTELALLRHQVSPHFFMNTLNNIHALVDFDAETAKDAIIRLSTLMRYLLYDTLDGQTSLKREVEFIQSYIALMKLRFSEKIVITVEVPEQIPDIQIPPMLFVSFLENSFKHGVSYQSKSFVSFSLRIMGDRLHCIIKNSKHKSVREIDKTHSGIGLSNIKKSLELLYKDDYTLTIDDLETEFDVFLNIPLLAKQKS